MTYVRSLIINILIVFFVDRVAPGIDITYYEQVPSVSADIIFAAFVGFLNATVFPFYTILEISPTILRMAIANALISYGAFIVIAIAPFGVQVVSPVGVLVGGSIVGAIAFFTNYLERNRGY